MQHIKKLINAAFVIINLPALALYFVLLPVSRKDSLFAGFSQAYSLMPGQVGNYLRRNFYRFTMAYCGKDVVISFGVLFSHAGVEIGSNVYIGPQSNIGLCKIEHNCLLGSGVHILSGKKQHNFKDQNQPLRMQGGHYEKITIANNVWIGNTAVVMANIGERSVIAAGAVVVDAVNNHAIMAGNPASLVKQIK